MGCLCSTTDVFVVSVIFGGNTGVRQRVFGRTGANQLSSEQINVYRLRWLGDVLSVFANRYPRQILFAKAGSGWEKAQGGQAMRWRRCMKMLTVSLIRIGDVRLVCLGVR